MDAGTGALVNITFKNTGTITWTKAAGHKLVAVGGSDPFTANTVIELGDADSIAPDQQKTFTVPNFVAPLTAGTYTSDWRMTQGAEPFGPTLTKSVQVVIPDPQTIIIESRSGGQNYSCYAEEGAFGDSSAKSGAEGFTGWIGTRYGSTYRSWSASRLPSLRPRSRRGSVAVRSLGGCANRRPRCFTGSSMPRGLRKSTSIRRRPTADGITWAPSASAAAVPVGSRCPMSTLTPQARCTPTPFDL